MRYFYRFKVMLFSAFLIGIMQMCVNGMQHVNKVAQPTKLLTQLKRFYKENIPYLPIKILSVVDEDLILSEMMGNDLIMRIRDFPKYQMFHVGQANLASFDISKLPTIPSDVDLFFVLSAFIGVIGDECQCRISVYKQHSDLSKFILDNNSKIAESAKNVKQREHLSNQEKVSYIEEDMQNIMEKDFYMVAIMCMKVQEKIILKCWQDLPLNRMNHTLCITIGFLYQNMELCYKRQRELLEQLLSKMEDQQQ